MKNPGPGGIPVEFLMVDINTATQMLYHIKENVWIEE